MLRAFGIGLGDTVALGPVPAFEAAVVTLAVARLGAVVVHTDDPAPTSHARVLVAGTDPSLDTGDVPVVTVDDARSCPGRW